MEEDQIQLITEQLGRLADKIGARMNVFEIELAHQKERMDEVKETIDDHETRLRAVQDTATRSQVLLGLFSGGSLFASIAAFIKAFIGAP